MSALLHVGATKCNKMPPYLLSEFVIELPGRQARCRAYDELKDTVQELLGAS